jgi:hypothetical protein
MDVYTGTNTGGAPLTLILLNKQRLDTAYGASGTTSLVNKLKTLADDVEVRGIVVPVENTTAIADAYNTWDTGNAYNPQVANQVAEAIKDVAAGYLDDYPTIHYLVLVGDDLMLPFYRVPDDSHIANEALYAGRSGLIADNPTHAALELGYILTDDFYADHTPLLWRGRELYVPDLAVGRLVETPSEMGTVIDAFLSDKSLEASTAFVSGYDFLTDSAEAIRDALGSGWTTLDTLIDDSWNATQLESDWLTNRKDLASVNAHFDHWQAIPADTSGGTLPTSAVSGASAMNGAVNFSMGCHSGFSVHDDHANTHALDFAQALAGEGAWWLANTGYGYGMDDSVAFSERLYYLFTQKLSSDSQMPVGEALRWAKNHYLGSVPSGGFGTYDEKIMIEATLYGLPMYRVSVPNPISLTALAAPPVSANDLPTEDMSFTPSFRLETGSADGDYYSIGGEVQASPGRPVQPRTSALIPSKAGKTPHGVVFVGGASSTEAINPLISRPLTDTKMTEPDFEAEGWFPSQPCTVNRLGENARLVIVPAQFQGYEGSGALRRFTSLQFQVYYAESSDDDFTVPTVWKVESQVTGSGVDFWVTTEDDSGIQRVVIAYTEEGSDQWQSHDLEYDSSQDQWEGQLGGLSGKFVYFVQVVDGAGNVTTTSNKGLFFEPARHTIYLPVVMKAY